MTTHIVGFRFSKINNQLYKFVIVISYTDMKKKLMLSTITRTIISLILLASALCLTWHSNTVTANPDLTAYVSENQTMTPEQRAYFQAAIDKMQAAIDIASSSGSENQTATTSDNVTFEKVRKPLSIGKEKRISKRLADARTTLNPEQQAFVDKQIEEKLKRIDTSLIRFQSGYSIHTTPGTIEAGIQDGEKIPANNYYLIQFYTDQSRVDKDTRDTLQQSGCVLYGYLANNAFYCRIPPEALDTVISLVESGKVRYLGNIPIEAKISPQLLAKTQINPDNSFHVTILLLGELNQSNIDTLRNFMQVDSYYPVPYILYGIATASSINDIAALNFVEWIEEETPLTLCNIDGTPANAEMEMQQTSSKWEMFISSLQQKFRELWYK